MNIVDTEFSTELNEERMAPNMTAVKKPSTGLGITYDTSIGYAELPLPQF